MRAASRRDWRQLGAITAEAFAEDPVNLWIFGNTGPMADVFGALARSVYLKRGGAISSTVPPPMVSSPACGGS